MTRRGLSVAPFKVGPDFIDPGHHSRITGSISRNLDGWMLSRTYNERLFARSAQQADIAVVEGVMGLYDGYDGRTEAGSSAQMAKWLGLPVLLVVDAGSMARSAAAVIRGFELFDPDVCFAGVVFNNMASPRHLAYLTDAMEDNVDMPCLGGLYRDGSLAIPERHLGLVTMEDHPLTDEMIGRLADAIENSIDLDALLDRLPEVGRPEDIPRPEAVPGGNRVRIGIARDNAFCFYYQDNFELLAAFGAEPVFFSPAADPALPPDIHGLYFGGGYPELFARRLSENTTMRAAVRTCAEAGMPIYGECGGFMYLCESLEDIDGRAHPMAGVFPFTTRMSSRLKSLGYREVTLDDDVLLGPAGQVIRGHEFHYSDLSAATGSVDTAYRVTGRTGMESPPEGYRSGRCLGSYIHLHFGSCPEAARCFVDACAAYKREKESNET